MTAGRVGRRESRRQQEVEVTVIRTETGAPSTSVGSYLHCSTARSLRSRANPTRSTPALATAPTSQIVTANQPTTCPLATAVTKPEERR